MQRAILFAIVILFGTQSTGVTALAGARDDYSRASFMDQIRLGLTHVIAYATATQIGAILTGNADRWNAMHAPAPQRPVAPKADASRAMLREKIRPLSRGAGLRGNPPPMLSEPPLLSELRKQRSTVPGLGSIGSLATAVHLPVHPGGNGATSSPRAIHPFDVSISSANSTGINPWWMYEEGALPGTGKYMVNVGTGNVLVQSDDIDIPERGIDLAFRRTYNSMSLNDTNASAGNDDGSLNENVYGNGWTNTFDAHIAPNTTGGISVFDIDGARYDYSPNGTNCLTPPPGMYNPLCNDGSAGWLWYKKSGTIYYFYGPFLSSWNAGYEGRLFLIWARNHNNRILFNYSWLNGDASSSNNLTQIVAGHSNGQTLTLGFGMVNGRPLLSSIARPDGSQVAYWYSSAHDLVSVGKIGNGSASVLTENYGYYAADKLAWTSNPRWNLSNGADGSFTNFYYDGTNRASGVLLYGFANVVPNDGTNTPLQSSIGTGANTIAYSSFTYPTGGETSLSDVDGHATNWFYDSLARITQTRDFTNGSSWLVTYASWDGNNNLTESMDVRGNLTDYAYDSNGNTIAIAQPAGTPGGFRPTTLYSYDRTNNANNIVAVCDPVFTHNHGQDWTSNPGTSDSLCPSQSGTTRYVWDYSDNTAEPFGRLAQSYTPLGYHRTYAYDSSAQGGDYGLPTAVTGDSFTQLDGTSRTPTQLFVYDGLGNLVCYSKLQDSTGTHWTRLNYDSLNRQTAVADPDDASLSVSGCSNTAGISGSYIESTTSYYPNGQIASTQSPSEHAASGVSTSYTYDADGDQIGETGGYGPSQKWYDGADRLVEVAEPTSGAVYGSLSADLFPWLTRYIYDLSQGNQVSMQYGTGFYAHGNLFKTQRYLPAKLITVQTTSGVITVMSAARGQAEKATKVAASEKSASQSAKPATPTLPRGSRRLSITIRPLTLAPRASSQAQLRTSKGIAPMSAPSGAGGQWLDVSGTAFDALDRKTSEYHYIPGGDTIATHGYTYDTSASGLLGSETTPVGDTKSYTYDTAGRMSGVSFGVSSSSTYTAGRSFTYDPDGRLASVGNSEFGTWQYSYDADGRLSSLAEPAGGGSGIPGSPYANSGVLTSPSTYLYSYYGNGWASQIQAEGTNASTQQESYRNDGLPQTHYYSTISGSITRQYTPGGRITNRTDPSGSDATTYDSYGREATQTVPSGTYSNFAYNDQGLPTSYRIYPVSGNYDEPHLLYNGTGQLACTQANFNYYGSCDWLFDGAAIAFTSSYYAPDNNQYTNNSIVDTRNLLVVGTAVEDGSGNVVFDTSNAYDANTRITQTVSPTTYDQQGQGFDWVYQTDHTYRYDAEDHTTSVADYSEMNSASIATHTYAWGPIGHPVTVGVNSGYEALHWDGDALAFETRSDASVNDYKLGPDGDVLSGTFIYPNDTGSGYAGATYYDRDAAGLAFADHNSSGHSAFSLCNGGPQANSPGGTLCNPVGTASGQQPGYYDTSSGTVFSYQRQDGVTDGSATIQGVRNYSAETSQWTTPDAYSGEIHDPMSQAKYMWNRNNPVAYADPSGYCPGPKKGAQEFVVVQVCAYISNKDNGTPFKLEKGDNRGPERTSPGNQPDSRLVVSIDFTNQNASAWIAHSHDMQGNDLGRGKLEFEQDWHGNNSVTITVLGLCGGCPDTAISPRIFAQGTFTLNADGTVSGSLLHSTYPAWEGYEYGGRNQTLFKVAPGTTAGWWGLLWHDTTKF